MPEVMLIALGVALGMAAALLAVKLEASRRPKQMDPRLLEQLEKGRRSFKDLSQMFKASLSGKEDLLIEATERKLVEEQIRKSEVRFRQLLDVLPQRVFYKDKDSVYVTCNKSYADLLGIDIKTIAGKTDYDFFPKEIAERYRADDRKFLAAGQGAEYEEPQVVNGKTFTIQTVKTPVRNEDGEVIGILGIFWDITERKQNEELVQKMHWDLEMAHFQLQDSLAQLVQSEKLAALGELTAGVAHELNQPLNITKIISQGIIRDIAKGRYSEAEAMRDLPEVVTQMDKMAAIISHMRVFTRKSDGLLMVKHDINELARDMLKFLRQQIRDHGILLEEHFSEGLPLIKADAIRIEQVFLNLLGNARHAVEDSGKAVKMIALRTYLSPDGKEVVFEVTDNGSGMTIEQQGKVFQPFFTTKAPGSGTGLGLSVSKKIVEEHGGRIELSSVAGEGSTFRVVLSVAPLESKE